MWRKYPSLSFQKKLISEKVTLKRKYTQKISHIKYSPFKNASQMADDEETEQPNYVKVLSIT